MPTDQSTKSLLGIPIVREHIKAAADDLARFEAASFEEYMESSIDDHSSSFAPNLESPLEALFYIWWQALAGPTRFWGSTFCLFTQMEIKAGDAAYRLDFVIGLTNDALEGLERRGQTWPLIAVEVDGHNFHEKTPQQVAYRNHRDRLLQQAGWLVLHFSWTEMTTRPLECVGEVLGVARSHYQRIMVEHARKVAAESASEGGK